MLIEIFSHFTSLHSLYKLTNVVEHLVTMLLYILTKLILNCCFKMHRIRPNEIQSFNYFIFHICLRNNSGTQGVRDIAVFTCGDILFSREILIKKLNFIEYRKPSEYI